MEPYLTVFETIGQQVIAALTSTGIRVVILEHLTPRTESEREVLETNIKVFHQGTSPARLLERIERVVDIEKIEYPSTEVVVSRSIEEKELVEREIDLSRLLSRYRHTLDDREYLVEVNGDRCNIYHKVSRLVKTIEHRPYGDRLILKLKR